VSFVSFVANVFPIRFWVIVLALAAPLDASAPPPTLPVPFLPQTEALCGGASAAMVFRYLGDRHAGVQQFESLVDTRAGGIANTVLVDAIRARGWNAQLLDGSIATIREQVATGHPLILLIEDRPSRYHYVVAVGGDDNTVFVHDPTWGPERHLTVSELLRRWKPTGFWTLLVTGTAAQPASATGATTPRTPDRGETECDRLLEAALDKIESDGQGAADEALGHVTRQCPAASAPLRELAGVRFSQRRWRDAATLAEQALDRNDSDTYAWDVLGSSRFIQDDTRGALQAWNHIDKPKVDSVQIVGLTRTRYALMSQYAGLASNAMLTARQLSLADRRLRELPDRVTTTVGYRPDDEGFATVNVAIVERTRTPHDVVDWVSLGMPAAVEREVRVAIPGNTGQGELWEAAWRWWNGRPRVAASFSAPRAGRLGGIWRVSGSWEAQTYSGLHDAGNPDGIREEQARGAISFLNWVTPNLRVEASSGIDAWNAASDSSVASGSDVASGLSRTPRTTTTRTVFIGGSIERRFAGDRLSVAGAATSWVTAGAGLPFHAGTLRAAARSSVEPTGFTVLGNIRADFVSAQAPLAIWSGAGDGRARPGLLRAHPLLHDGVIDGPVFGRHVQSATLELQRWFRRPDVPRLGIAVFADTAHAAERLFVSTGRPFQLDLGAGVRLHVPGSDRTLRLDYAHGLRDRRAHAISATLESSPTR
jgi:peptidase C39-like protein